VRAGLAGRLARVLPEYLHTGAWAISRRFGSSRPPLMIVQGVILSDDGVLLAVRVEPRGWEIPGGNPEVGEGDEAALLREVREETGIEVSVGSLVGEYHRSGFLPHTARVYRCRPVGGEIAPSLETPRVRWWDPGDIPDTLFPWCRQPLRDALDHLEAPVVRHQHQGVSDVIESVKIDLRMRLSGDRAV
jgi:8-oxo-dGTP pyrophosphatase MutT (NUDIX family)